MGMGHGLWGEWLRATKIRGLRVRSGLYGEGLRAAGLGGLMGRYGLWAVVRAAKG